MRDKVTEMAFKAKKDNVFASGKVHRFDDSQRDLRDSFKAAEQAEEDLY